MAKIKALFLSDETLVLSALKRIFSHSPFILANFSNYSNFNELLHSEKSGYNVIIFDDSCLKMRELEIINDFIVENTHIKKILFTCRTDIKYLEHFIRGGVDGILSKKEKTRKLKDAIISVLGNKKYYSQIILDYILNNEQSNKKTLLSSREREIARHSNMGLGNKQIAQKLCLSIKTVENHKQNIKKKLGLASITKLIFLEIPL
jgi:DNA-binding NarL/FixJ family response regulator